MSEHESPACPIHGTPSTPYDHADAPSWLCTDPAWARHIWWALDPADPNYRLAASSSPASSGTSAEGADRG